MKFTVLTVKQSIISVNLAFRYTQKSCQKLRLQKE